MCLYLTKRNSTYYFRRVIPAELRASIGQSEWTFSLLTKERDEAKQLRDFHAHRTTTELKKASELLARSRSCADVPMNGAWLGEFAAEEAAFAARKEAASAQRKVERQLERDRLRERLHGSTERMEDRYAAMHDLIAEAEERGARSVRLEDRSVSVELPRTSDGSETDTRQGKGRQTKLDPALVDLWAAERRPKQKTIDAHRVVARTFIRLVADKAIADLTRDDALRFKDALIADGQKAANIKVKLSRLRTLTSWACTNGYASINAALGITIKVPRSEQVKRKSYDLASLRLVFGSPVFTIGARPTGCRGEAAYWLPLLGLFTGARLEELGQLRAENVRQVDYVDADGRDATAWVLSIESRDDVGHVVKTEDSERLVPVHAELVRLGFLRFARESESNEGGKLFPELKPNTYGTVTAKWGEWFSRYRRETCLVTDRRLVFHSFRHTFKDQARHVGMPQGVQRQIMGHSPGDLPEEYGEGQSLHQLVLGMQLYRVPGLVIAGC